MRIRYHFAMQRDCDGTTRKKLLAHADLKGKQLLEIGCGTGRISGMLKNDARRIVGIEPTFGAVCTAAQTIPEASFICGTGMNLPFTDKSFDVVLFSLSLHHHPDYQAALVEARRVTGWDGVVLVLEPTPESEIQKFCKAFEDEDHRLIAAEETLQHCHLETVAREKFKTHWEFENFEDAADYGFTYYDQPHDEKKRQYLLRFLGEKAAHTPIRMTDTLRLTCLRSPDR